MAIGSAVTRAPQRFARYSKRNRAPAALLLFGLAVGLWAFRRRRLPTARQAAGFLIGATIIVLAASVVPELVVGFLAAALLAIALDDSAAIANLAGRLTALLDVSPRSSPSSLAASNGLAPR